MWVQTLVKRYVPYILILCNILIVRTDATVIQTKIGKIRGLEETTSSQQIKYYAFKGIRYAQAPTGSLRFKEPVPIPAWEGIMDATLDGQPCPQLHIGTNSVIGKEDCLSLNVYSPDVDKLKPVLVFIHGGGFTTGSSSSLMYGPDYLMDEDVVVVSFNYRLSVFGFLSTESKESTGNYGLFDQILALEWVKRHVASFGGDPEKITLLGEGAGAASATLLTLTPTAKGLFRNVIAIGGTPLNSQYFQSNPVESARELVSRFDCTYEDFGELVECLRKQDAEKLVKEVNNMFSFFSFPRWFSPSFDNVLFSSSPQELLQSGKVAAKVPILMGLARHEGAFYVPLTLNSFSDGKYDGNFIDQRIPRLLPVISEFESKLFPITRAIKKRYFTNIDVENEDEFTPRYVELLTDMLFTRFSSKYAGMLSNNSIPVYYYVLQYYGSHSIMDVIGDSTTKMIAHGDVLFYIFTQILGENVRLPQDDKDFATKTFLPLLLNFVRTSNPTPSGSSFGETWPKFNAKDQTVCLIGRKISLQKDFRSNILKFWETEVPNIGKTKEEL
ncbi:neuroligin-4, X-linked [Folsomia candida]|uniref:Neuroligin-4, X-linked n=1 Tax=Folsomia candida TaxID=158441 RepID=A0A226F3K0_FOLCA|nr:neuroligin-4, X-linked [Folsomia candida]OXA64027.1 Neuroligin-4, X-linked [Folsomia candida]